MLRRAVTPQQVLVAGASLRSVAEYNFGHVSLDRTFEPPQQQLGNALTTRAAGPIKVTTLSNGIKCVSQNLDGAQVSIGVYAEAGAKHDPRNVSGLNHILRAALTTSNFDNSMFQVDRTIRAFGVSQEHFEVRKKFIGVRLDSRLDKWEPSAAHLFTCFSAPRFHEADIEKFRDHFDNILEECRWQRPRDYVTNLVETVAFSREPLGNSRDILPNTNDAASSAKLMDQFCKYVVPSRMVVAGVNVDHGSLIAAYENNPYPHSELAPHHARLAKDRKAYDESTEDLQYTGGEKFEQEMRAKEMGNKPDMDYETIVALAFKSNGRDAGITDFAAGLVAKQVLDIVLKDAIRYDRCGNTHGVRSFYSPYSSTGLLGFTIQSSPEDSVKLLTDCHLAFQSLKVTPADLAIAQERAAVAFYTAEIELVRDYCDFLATNLNKNGTKATESEEVFEAIRNTSVADVQRVFTKGLAAKASLYGTGETLAYPSLRQLGIK